MRSHLYRPAACLVGAMLLITACQVFTPTPTALPGVDTPPVTGGEATPTAATGEETSQAEAWITATLNLRSVTMRLETIYAASDPAPVTIQVDGSGNRHITMPMPFPEEAAANPEFSPPGDFELFIVSGAAYNRIGVDMPLEADDGYLSMQEDLLLGPEGPGFWLDLLAEEDFTAGGTETLGGFTTTRYAVDGQVAGDGIAGTTWIDQATSALIGADLVIPQSTFYPPGSSESGDVRITFQVEMADVPPITLP